MWRKTLYTVFGILLCIALMVVLLPQLLGLALPYLFKPYQLSIANYKASWCSQGLMVEQLKLTHEQHPALELDQLLLGLDRTHWQPIIKLKHGAFWYWPYNSASKNRSSDAPITLLQKLPPATIEQFDIYQLPGLNHLQLQSHLQKSDELQAWQLWVRDSNSQKLLTSELQINWKQNRYHWQTWLSGKLLTPREPHALNLDKAYLTLNANGSLPSRLQLAQLLEDSTSKADLDIKLPASALTLSPHESLPVQGDLSATLKLQQGVLQIPDLKITAASTQQDKTGNSQYWDKLVKSLQLPEKLNRELQQAPLQQIDLNGQIFYDIKQQRWLKPTQVNVNVEADGQKWSLGLQSELTQPVVLPLQQNTQSVLQPVHMQLKTTSQIKLPSLQLQQQGEFRLTLGAINSSKPYLNIGAGSLLSINYLHYQHYSARKIALSAPTTLELNQKPIPEWQGQLELKAEGIQTKPNQPSLPDITLNLKSEGNTNEWHAPFTLVMGAGAQGSGFFSYNDQQLEIKAQTDNLTASGLETLLKPIEAWPHSLTINHLEPKLTLHYLYPAKRGQLQLVINGASGLYSDIELHDLNTQLAFNLNQGKVHTTGANTIKLEKLNAGVLMQQLEGHLNVSGPVNAPNISLKKLRFKLLGGDVSAANMPVWPWQGSSQILFKGISLPELVALQNQPGLNISGQIAGEIPLQISSAGIEVKHASLHSEGGGIIDLTEYDSAQALKQNNPSLGFAVNLLENFHYSSMTGKADYQPSGELNMDIHLVGENLDSAGKQPIHFNYHHEEKILQLLTSLRLANQISSDLEHHFNPSEQ